MSLLRSLVGWGAPFPGACAPGYRLPPLRGWFVGGATRIVEGRRGLRFRRTLRGGLSVNGSAPRLVDWRGDTRCRGMSWVALSTHAPRVGYWVFAPRRGWSPEIRGARTCGSQGREPLGLAPHHTLNPGGVTCGFQVAPPELGGLGAPFPEARAPGYHLPPLRGWLVGGAARVVEERRGLRFRRTRCGGLSVNGSAPRLVDWRGDTRCRGMSWIALSTHAPRWVIGYSGRGWSPEIRGARTCGSQGREPLGLVPHRTSNPGGVAGGYPASS